MYDRKGEFFMKIAVACDENQQCSHFGHSDHFAIFETDGERISAEEHIPNPGHRPGFLPNMLGDLGVDVMIAGSMGGGASEIFRQRQIPVIVGAIGNAREAVERYLRGALKSTGVICHEHQHAGSCGHEGHCEH